MKQLEKETKNARADEGTIYINKERTN